MALRSLSTEISFQDNATQALQGVDSEIDGVRDNVEGTQDNFEELGYETGETAYSMQGDLQDVGSATDELGHQTSGFGDTMGRVGGAVQRNWKMVAGGIGAAGVALEGLIRSQQDLELQTERTAIMMDAESDALRDTVIAEGDHTLSVEDSLRARQRLIQSGYDEEEQLNRLVPLFDKLADATGTDIVDAIDSAYYVLHGLGGELGDVEEHLDDFTWMQTRTRVGMSELQRVMLQLGDDFQGMGMSTEDVIALMGVMSDQMDAGPGMMSDLNKAMEGGEQTQEDFLEKLGYTNEMMDEQRESMQGAEGITKELNDALEENATFLERQQDRLERNVYGYGEFIANLDVLSGAMSGILPLLGAAVGVQYLTGISAGVAAKGVWGLTVAFFASPIGWIVAGIIGVIAILHLLGIGFDDIAAAAGVAWDWITDKIGAAVDWITSIDLYEVGMDIIKGLGEGIMGAIDWVVDGITGVGEAITGGIKGFFGISSPATLMIEYGGYIGEGLHLGMEQESEDFFRRAGQMFSPERTPTPAAAGGASIGIGDIHVYSQSDNPREVAQEVKRTLRREFSTEANRYFGRQRRKR